MQKLKFEFRKLINALALGEKSLLLDVMNQLMIRLKREDTLYLTVEEIKNVFNGNTVKYVLERHALSFVRWGKEKGSLLIENGAKANEFIQKLQTKKVSQEVLVVGQSACRGIAKGRARIVPFSLDPKIYMANFKKGEVLISTTTGPEMVSIMKKAAAIVIEEGGLMSHAAIVAREFNIPCVVGTKCATEVFKDGDLVEVDADKGVIKVLKKSHS